MAPSRAVGRKAQRQLARQELARQRVDLALIPNMLFGIATSTGVDDIVVEAIRLACFEPLEGLDRHQQVCAAKRITALVHQVMDPFAGHAMAKVMVMVFRLMEMVTKLEIIQVPPEHPFVLAMEAMANELADADEHPGAWTEAIDSSATKQARKVLAQLQAQGYLLPPP